MIVSKRGGIEDTLTSVVVAVICLIILGGIAVLVYKTLTTSEYKNAGKVLDFIEMKINAINADESTSFSVQSPCKSDVKNCPWLIAGWGKESIKKPDRCYFDSCLGICKFDPNLFGKGGYEESILADCQDSSTGICKSFNFDKINITDFYTVQITEMFVFKYNFKRTSNVVFLVDPLSRFVLSKTTTGLNISHYSTRVR